MSEAPVTAKRTGFKVAACAFAMGTLVVVSVFARNQDRKQDKASQGPGVAQAQQPRRIHVDEDLQKTRLEYVVYPPIPDKNMEGTVLLHVLIGKDGAVSDARYVSGPTNLVSAATNAVRQWRYKPTLINGVPVEVDTQVSIVVPLRCPCIGNPAPCEAAWETSAVFVGRVYWNSLRASKNALGRDVFRRVIQVKVLESFVGNVSGWVNVETGLDECGFDFSSWGEYVIYARREEDGTLTTSSCSRTRKVSDATVDLDYLRSIKYLPNYGRVYGRVSLYGMEPDFNTIRPLPGAIVRLRSEEKNSEQTRQAGGNGDFAFEDLAPGRYSFSVDLPSVMTPYSSLKFTVPAKGCHVVDVGTAYNGRLEGKVLDQKGVAIPYVRVEAIRAAEAEMGERVFLRTYTGYDGTFIVGNLPPGDYLLGVRTGKNDGEQLGPRTYYPGVITLERAKRIRLVEGQLVQGLVFRVELPD